MRERCATRDRLPLGCPSRSFAGLTRSWRLFAFPWCQATARIIDGRLVPRAEPVVVSRKSAVNNCPGDGVYLLQGEDAARGTALHWACRSIPAGPYDFMAC